MQSVRIITTALQFATEIVNQIELDLKINAIYAKIMAIGLLIAQKAMELVFQEVNALNAMKEVI